MEPISQLSLKAFLSHRYKSPEINSYFFNLFTNRAEVHFEVDLGSVATNVTRLERMVRSCEAFIGIYPYPGSGDLAPRHEELLKASPYFRLELDLAIRSQKPALVFHDRQYGGILRWSRDIRFVEFDSAEILGSSRPPSEGRFRRAFEQFANTVASSQAYNQSVDHSMPTDIGILLPDDHDGTGYTNEEITAVRNVLHDHGYQELRPITYPGRLDRDMFLLLEGLDWVIVDVGDHKAASLVAYMHGQFIPTMRLLKSPAASATSHLVGTLYRGTEVGYTKDIIAWADILSLEKGLSNRLTSLRQGVRYISKPEQARDYFLEASRRKKRVFFSYAREDEDLASNFARRLRESFEHVFDYRDGQSLVPGEGWEAQIESEIQKSDLGIAFLSPDYMTSTNCRKELDMMLTARTNSRFLLYPIKIQQERLTLPPELSERHYLRWWEYSDSDSIIEHVTAWFDRASIGPSENRGPTTEI
jgi:hypothetical protein